MGDNAPSLPSAKEQGSPRIGRKAGHQSKKKMGQRLCQAVF